MLKKLFKHEWHDCWRLMALVNGIVIAMTVIGLFVFMDDFWVDGGGERNRLVPIIMVMYLLLYIVSVSALGFVVSLYFYVRFYQNLYTDQGYLMHTLPVTEAQLIWSKAFVGVIWHVISMVVMFSSVLTLVFWMNAATSGENILSLLNRIMGELELPQYFPLLVLETVVLGIISCFFTLFIGYTAISVGQLCKKRKVLGAIGAYLVIYLIIQVVGAFGTVPIGDYLSVISESNDPLMYVAGLFLFIVGTALVTAALYFINAYIMKVRLNLE